MAVILETPRLLLRELTSDDVGDLCEIMQDQETMYAYEGPFSDREVRDWLERNLTRYREDGFGLWAVVLRETGEMVGQTGLTMQRVRDRQVPEIGYLFKRRHWHNGYAAEAAIACKNHAFETLGIPTVYSIIRDSNLPSQRVAQRNGMAVVDTFVKHYRGVNMPHLVYAVDAPKSGAAASESEEHPKG